MHLFVLVLLATTPRFEAQLRQLKQAPHPATRAMAAKELAESDRPEAVKPLCDALADSPEVAAAAASSLEALKDPSAIGCLKQAKNTDATLRDAVKHALASLEPRAHAKHKFFVALAPVQPHDVDAAVADEAGRTLARHLELRGAELFAASVTRKQALAREKRARLNGWLLTPTITYQGGQLTMSLLCARYPEGNILGEAEMKGSGDELEDIVHAMVDRLLNDATLVCSLPH